MKMKTKYIVEVTRIDLIPCKNKKEVECQIKKRKNDNIEVLNQEEFKEIYGRSYE